MAYDNKLKANKEIFENNQTITVFENITLKPIFFNLLDQEASFYCLNSQTESVKKYLPSAYVESDEQAKNKLLEFYGNTLFKGSLFYCIRTEDQFPIGYIQMNSPLSPTGLDGWTVDFWLGEDYQGNGMMAASLNQFLYYLQQNAVPEVYALVHPTNIKAINVLEKVSFQLFYPETGVEQRLLYKVLLN